VPSTPAPSFLSQEHIHHHRQAKQSHGVNSSNLVNNSILSCPSRFMISAVCFFPKYEKLVAVELKNQSTNSSRHCYTKFKIPAGDFGPGISLQNIGFSFFYLRHTFFITVHFVITCPYSVQCTLNNGIGKYETDCMYAWTLNCWTVRVSTTEVVAGVLVTETQYFPRAPAPNLGLEDRNPQPWHKFSFFVKLFFLQTLLSPRHCSVAAAHIYSDIWIIIFISSLQAFLSNIVLLLYKLLNVNMQCEDIVGCSIKKMSIKIAKVLSN